MCSPLLCPEKSDELDREVEIEVENIPITPNKDVKDNKDTVGTVGESVPTDTVTSSSTESGSSSGPGSGPSSGISSVSSSGSTPTNVVRRAGVVRGIHNQTLTQVRNYSTSLCLTKVDFISHDLT